MAVVDDDGEHARFSCLAMARYVVATVVTVLAVAVIIMVITVDVHRPEDISLSVLQGHVEATALWKVVEQGRGSQSKNKALASLPTEVPGAETEIYGGPYIPSTAYVAADYASFGFVLRAGNPGGRADINCSGISIGFFDMPNGPENRTGMMMKIIFWQDPQFSFFVKRKSSHMLRRWVTTSNKTVLSYLASTYGGRSSFTGVLQVELNISSVTLLGQTSPRRVRHNCWSLAVSVDQPSATAEEVRCTQDT